MKTAARARCTARIGRVRELARSATERRRKELEAERRLQRELMRAEGLIRRREQLRTRVEARQESDDDVRANLPEGLIAVFNRVRRAIRASPRMSRTESFLHWAEDNPTEVIAIQSAAAEVELERLLKE
jgi:hypothetical protein